MFVSYKWLQQYVDIDGLTAEQLADKITKAGIEVEGVELFKSRGNKCRCRLCDGARKSIRKQIN
ncbi:hypothetical protein GCM10020331_033170 [Ectobacillus funiculus]